MSPAFFDQAPNDRRQSSDSPCQAVASDAAVPDATASKGSQGDVMAWQTVNFPTLLPVEQIAGMSSYLRNQTMDSSSRKSSVSNSGTNPREAELLDLVKDLNECNDVLLAKVSQLEEALERSQTALQAEIERETAVGETLPDRNIAHLVTELEQANQALQQQQQLNQNLGAEVASLRADHGRLVAEYESLSQNSQEQSYRLKQADRSHKDLKARLQRQQRYTLQFKAALEKCLGVSATAQTAPPADSLDSPVANDDCHQTATADFTKKTGQIRAWEASPMLEPVDPRLQAILHGASFAFSQETSSQGPDKPSALNQDISRGKPEAWHDLSSQASFVETIKTLQLQTKDPGSDVDSDSNALGSDSNITDARSSGQLTNSPRQESAQAESEQSYIPAMAPTSGGPAPLVNPLRSHRRIDSLAAIDLPSFPRLQQTAHKTETHPSLSSTEASS